MTTFDKNMNLAHALIRLDRAHITQAMLIGVNALHLKNEDLNAHIQRTLTGLCLHWRSTRRIKEFHFDFEYNPDMCTPRAFRCVTLDIKLTVREHVLSMPETGSVHISITDLHGVVYTIVNEALVHEKLGEL